MIDEKVTKWTVFSLILVLVTWFYFMYIPAKMLSLAKEIHAPDVQYVPTYDCYEYDPTYEPGKYESENEGAP